MPLLTDSLTIPPASSLNGTGKSAAARQLPAAAERAVVPLVYGEDRISGLILNVLSAAGTPGTLLVQVLWCHACDSVNDVRLNDQALPAGASITHYTGAQTSTDATLAAAFAAQGITGVRPLTGYAWSLLSMPAALFDGQINVTARIRGRRCYDPAFDSTAGGVGPQRLADATTWAFTDIPAVCLGDFLASTVYGCGVAVNWDSVRITSAANRVIVPGSSEQRRLVGVSFTSAAAASDVAETLRAYACCYLLPSASGVRLLPDQDDSPVAAYRHADGQIVAIEALELRDLGQAPTAVEVIYTDRSAIPWRDASAIAQLDGAGTTKPWRLSQVRLPGVHRFGQAKREATERLNKLNLNDITTVLEVHDIGIKHEQGDIIIVTHPLGLSETAMRISGPPTMPAPGRWRLPLVRHSAAAYSDIVASAAAIQDAQRIVPAPARLGIKLNVQDFAGTLNYGEAYTHAVDANGNALDAPGSILVNGVATPLPNRVIYTSQGPVAGYIGWDSSGPNWPIGSGVDYALIRRFQGAWQFDNNGGWVSFTPGPQHFIIGTLETGSSDAGEAGTAPGIVAASLLPSASTLNSLESSADAAYALAASMEALTLINDAGMTVIGNSATKAGGTAGWNAAVRSKDGYVGGAFVSFTLATLGCSLVVGLNADPTTDNGFSGIDRALYVDGSDNKLYAMESGAGTDLGVTCVVNDVLAVAYDGSTVRYLRNGVVLRTVAASISSALFLDSSFNDVGGGVKNIKFGPMTSNAWAAIGGTGKPADNATVNNVTYSMSAPGSAVDGDIWVDLSTSPARIKLRVSGNWQSGATLTTNTNQLTDGANLGSTAVWGMVSGTGKPADSATKNVLTRSTSAPSSPTDGDLWCDTSLTPNVWKVRLGGTWQPAASYVTNTADIVDGANLGLTAVWTGVTGTGKPADNATRNYTYSQSGDPVSSPGGVVNGETWLQTSTGKTFVRVSGAWVAVVGTGSVNTNELADQAATVVAVFSDTGVTYSNIG